MKKIKMGFVTALFSIVLFGCVSDEERFKKELLTVDRQVTSSLDTLKGHLDAKRLRNSKLLTEYGEVVKKERPDMVSIVDLLVSDGASNGDMYNSLLTRKKEAKDNIDSVSKNGEQNVVKLLQEYDSIQAGVRNYNTALSDSVNVLADMSGGKLTRITPLEEEAKVQPGEEFVGNPQYGSWKSDSSGGTFWEWYGKYALFSSMFRGPMYYDSWASGRRYSYYHDVGRNHYTSPSQKATQRNTVARVKKQYSQSGKKFQSPYAKNLAPKSIQKQSLVSKPNKFSSKYASTSKSSKNSSSGSSNKSSYNSRSSSSSRSRSSRSGGK